MRKIIVGVLLLMSILLPGNPARSAETSRVYPVRELWEAFERDRLAAQKTFAGQRISFEGVVLSSGSSEYLTPMVVLSDEPGGKRYLAAILPRSDFLKLSDYKRGQTYRFNGFCRGLTYDGSMVLVKESKGLD